MVLQTSIYPRRSLYNSIFTSHVTKQTAFRRHVFSVVASASNAPKIAVVGGGVIGLTCALRLLERSPQAEVTIIASALAVDTTSAGAAGLWKPYAISGTPPEKVNKWGKDTFTHYLDIFNSPDAATAGIFLCPAYELYYDPVPDPDWSTAVPSYRHLSTADLEMYDAQKIYKYGFAYDTIIAEGRLYMQWLLEKIRATGRATILTGCHVESLTELSSYGDFVAVMNCAGLGARELVKDASVYPIRGHVLRVKAPWVRYHVEAEQRDTPDLPAYIIPNSDTVVLGGTKRLNDEDITPRKEDRDAILARCTAAVPSLAVAEVVDEWVGLRPGRPSVRLELERFDSSTSTTGTKSSSEDMPPFVVHNYGHGGSGLTLAWGCAGEAVDLIAEHIL